LYWIKTDTNPRTGVIVKIGNVQSITPAANLRIRWGIGLEGLLILLHNRATYRPALIRVNARAHGGPPPENE
jgi:hypothetical protein